jgi:hypothetical protein
MKILIPDDLRQQILDCQSDLRAQLARASSDNQKSSNELAGLEAEREKIGNEIVGLKQAALHSSRAASELVEHERRQDLIAGRLRELNEARESCEPVTLGQAKEVLQAIVRFYRNSLPEAYADHNREFFASREQALHKAPLADAITVLHRITSIAYSLESAAADGSYFGLINKIFERALRGQVHLGVDLNNDEQEASA